jgi:tetratricopeptide (TPR) repeat protein
VPKAGETGAAELYAELLARAEAALGPSHSLTGIIRFNTARYLFGAGKREAADAEGRKALRVIQTVFGAESRTAATIELLLGRIAEEREQFAQAETFAGQAMAHFDAVERQEGRVYSAALGAVDLSAHLARHRGEQTMAAALFDRGAAMAARSGLGAPMQALEIASNAASVRLEAQLWPEALKQLQGLMAQIELHGLQQTFVGIQIRGNLGIARLGVGDPSAAVVDLEAALRDVVSLADTIPDLAPLEPILRAKLEEARSRLRHRR